MYDTADFAATAAATMPRVSSHLLQGNSQSCVSNLFLFPGEFGTFEFFRSSFSIDPNFVAVFELSSILSDSTEELANVGIPKLASLYLEEIRRRQPHGPYSLLGYSVGGIIAYEAAQQLLTAGEAVERLYLVDSPCPLAIRPMPPSVLEFIAAYSDSRLPVSAKQSVSVRRGNGTVGFESYKPKRLSPYPGHPVPKTTYYVAKQGLNPRHSAGPPIFVSGRDKSIMSWLFDDRGATGDGWERLVDRAKLKIVPVEGDHLSIMEDSNIWAWAAELRSSYWDSSFPFKTRSTRRRH